MKTLFLGGHGQWNISDGYTQVPVGCTISFYTDFSKNMFTSDMKDIMKGTYGGSVQQKIEQYKKCPNYTLSADPASHQECKDILVARNNANLGLLMFSAGPSWTLQRIFEKIAKNKLKVDMVWCACRFTGLNDAGGKAIGVNAAQGTWGNRNNLGNLVTPGGNPDTLFYFNPTSKVVKNLT